MIMYGVSLADIKINEDKAIAFLHELADNGYDCYLSDYMESVENYDISTFSEWVDDFESDGYFGLSAFLWRIIKTLENINIDVESEEGCEYLGLLLRLPWDFNQKTRNITIEGYNNILRKYINKVTDDVLDIDCIYYLSDD